MARPFDFADSVADTLRRGGQLPQTAPKVIPAGLDPKQQRASPAPGKDLASVCDAVAVEIQETGQSVVNIANTIAAESDALAELLHKHGTAMAARIEQFISMSDRVKIRMREAHDDMLVKSGVGPSLAPHDGQGEN